MSIFNNPPKFGNAETQTNWKTKTKTEKFFSALLEKKKK